MEPQASTAQSLSQRGDGWAATEGQNDTANAANS